MPGKVSAATAIRSLLLSACLLLGVPAAFIAGTAYRPGDQAAGAPAEVTHCGPTRWSGAVLASSP